MLLSEYLFCYLFIKMTSMQNLVLLDMLIFRLRELSFWMSYFYAYFTFAVIGIYVITLIAKIQMCQFYDFQSFSYLIFDRCMPKV